MKSVFTIPFQDVPRIKMPWRKFLFPKWAGVVMASGSATLANMRISAINGRAFIDFSLPGTLTNYLGRLLTITDSAGKTLTGWIQAAGTGETYGADQHTAYNAAADPMGHEANATTGWGAYAGCTLTSDGDVKAVGSWSLKAIGGGNNSRTSRNIGGLTVGCLYRLTLKARHLGSGGEWRIGITDGDLIAEPWLLAALTSSDVTFLDYILHFVVQHDTALGRDTDYIQARENNAGDDGGVYLDNISYVQVLTPSATGVTIVSTRGGNTRNWASVQGGFHMNDPNGYSYRITNA
jgi:hypothetical protein